VNARLVQLTRTAKEDTVSIPQITPYLHFDGQADAAIEHYIQALGGRVVALMRQSEAPGMPAETRNRVMHCELRIGDASIMVGDVMPGAPAVIDSSIHVCVQFTDPAEMSRRFAALAAGGTTDYPIHDSFWGSKFGMLTDRFGIHWMFNCEAKKA
jgi:PhnB protein